MTEQDPEIEETTADDYLNGQTEDKMETEEQPFGVNDTVGAPSSIKNEEEKDEKNAGQQENTGELAQGEESLGNNQQQDANDIEKRVQQQKMNINPYRSLGDVKKEWRKRLNMTEEEEDTISNENVKEEKLKEAQYRFMKEEEKNEDTQALGPSEAPENIPMDQQEEEQNVELEEEEEIQPMELDKEDKEMKSDVKTQAASLKKLLVDDKEDVQPMEGEIAHPEDEDDTEEKKTDKISTMAPEKQEEEQNAIIKREFTPEDIGRIRDELESDLLKGRSNDQVIIISIKHTVCRSGPLEKVRVYH